MFHHGLDDFRPNALDDNMHTNNNKLSECIYRIKNTYSYRYVETHLEWRYQRHKMCRKITRILIEDNMPFFLLKFYCAERLFFVHIVCVSLQSKD